MEKKHKLLLLCAVILLVIIGIMIRHRKKDNVIDVFPTYLHSSRQFLLYQIDNPNQYTFIGSVANSLDADTIGMFEGIVNAIVNSNKYCITNAFRDSDDNRVGDWDTIEKEVCDSYEWMLVGIGSTIHDASGRIRPEEFHCCMMVDGDKWILYDDKGVLVAASTQWGAVYTAFKDSVMKHAGFIYVYDITDGEDVIGVLLSGIWK